LGKEIFFELCEKLGTIPQNCDYKIINRYFNSPLNNNNDNNTIDIDIEPKPFIYL
jgi:hypothetical protein